MNCNIAADPKGLKTAIKSFLISKKIGHRIEKMYDPATTTHYTNLQIESSVDVNLLKVKVELQSAIMSMFPAITRDMFQWSVMDHENPIKSSTISRTRDPAAGREDSSGLIDAVDDIAPKDSISNAISLTSSAIHQIGEAFVSGLQFAGKAAKTVIKVETTRGKLGGFNISPTLTWAGLLESLSMSAELGLNAPAKKLYWKSDGKLYPISDIAALLNEHQYVVFTDLDTLPVLTPESSIPTSPETKRFASMEEFYEALQKDEGLDYEDIDIIKGVFDKEKIKVKQLQRLTNEDLKEYGLNQGGLRKAILAVLGK